MLDTRLQRGIALSTRGCRMQCSQDEAENTALDFIPFLLQHIDHFQAARDMWAFVLELPWEGSVQARSGQAVLPLSFLLQG